MRKKTKPRATRRADAAAVEKAWGDRRDALRTINEMEQGVRAFAGAGTLTSPPQHAELSAHTVLIIQTALRVLRNPDYRAVVHPDIDVNRAETELGEYYDVNGRLRT